MKLICPNCGAQYAVDDRVIPETGRDVQCSSCGHTWFQRHPDHDPELAEELGWEQPSRGLQSPSPAPEPEPEPVARQADTAEETVGEYEDAAPQADEIDEAPEEPDYSAEFGAAPEQAPMDAATEPVAEEPVEEPARRRVDEDVLSVLREEAEREQAARRAETAIPEYQPELAMPEPEPTPRHGTADYAEKAPERDEFAPYGYTSAGYPAPAPVSSRRELLPDVEEISPSLDGDEEGYDGRGYVDYETRQMRKRGSRIGVGLAFLIFGALALVYARSDKIAESIPSSAEPLAGYVATVDAGRVWLDRTLRDIVSGSPQDGGTEG
ncbi:zinc-ribbon domain-containing protein [Tropicimonas sediminicola]|uniref:MJ0042 family finger-like domain-containing protein n=1 Tax=Tropicimonas sediminicola TaxID=1031541 RepID=A0A239I6V7_9RHOB|nr:zinc-ribbon domain-containing protein [Tropicimonas sediminicola]SNS89626.1 MJ0042 family finger-like domain-containing protein [Tropicimonas sediminicola]